MNIRFSSRNSVRHIKRWAINSELTVSCLDRELALSHTSHRVDMGQKHFIPTAMLYQQSSVTSAAPITTKFTFSQDILVHSTSSPLKTMTSVCTQVRQFVKANNNSWSGSPDFTLERSLQHHLLLHRLPGSHLAASKMLLKEARLTVRPA